MLHLYNDVFSTFFLVLYKCLIIFNDRLLYNPKSVDFIKYKDNENYNNYIVLMFIIESSCYFFICILRYYNYRTKTAEAEKHQLPSNRKNSNDTNRMTECDSMDELERLGNLNFSTHSS